MIESFREGHRDDLGRFEMALQGWLQGERTLRTEAAGRDVAELVLRELMQLRSEQTKR